MNRYYSQKILKPLWISLICAVIAVVFTIPLSASSIVDPARFLFTVKPGANVTGMIKVTNPSKTESEVNAVVYDWTLNNLDKMVASPLGTRSDSLKNMIKFNPRQFKLAPGESQIVRFTLSPPSNIKLSEYRGIVFFEEKNKQASSSSGADVVTQVGSTIYLGIEGMKMAFGLSKVTLKKESKRSYRLKAEIVNQGSGHVRYIIQYKIIGQKGKLVAEESLSDQVILPGFKKAITFPIAKKLEPGKYNLALTINFLGTERSATKTIPFEVNN
jgi:P pilus assembly chaperone PapD